MYHVINRGNYRRDVFETTGTAKAFEVTLDEACEQHGWKLHAYVILRNHFHLALTTPEPNLVEGMHWLQSTFASRFNRLRGERGHLFQGRYQALLIEDDAALIRVVDYIHLNPVRARIVAAEQVARFRWSSLRRFTKPERPVWFSAGDWLGRLGLVDSAAGWRSYVAGLAELAEDEARQKELGFEQMSRGWAIGTDAWRKAIARDHAHLKLDSGYAAGEIRELKEARWQEKLSTLLSAAGKSLEDAAADSKGAAWKRGLAVELRRTVGAPHGWIAERLAMGSPHALRAHLSRTRSRIEQQTSA